jgi:DNA-binding NtrC family response regulator
METPNHIVLVVDDEPVNLMMLEKVLSSQVTVRTASSGQQALEILHREEVSLLITDQRMPGMSGTELLRQSRERYPDMACFLLTAENDVKTFFDAIVNMGAICVINKPWDPVHLLSTVATALKNYERLHHNKQAMDQLKKATQSLNRFVKNE